MKALIQDNNVIKYPVSRGYLKKLFPNTSIPRDISHFGLSDYSVVDVITVDKNPDKFVVKSSLVKTGEHWVQKREYRDYTTEETEAIEAAALIKEKRKNKAEFKSLADKYAEWALTNEAEQYKKDKTFKPPFLTSISSENGQTVDDLIDTILNRRAGCQLSTKTTI